MKNEIKRQPEVYANLATFTAAADSYYYNNTEEKGLSFRGIVTNGDPLLASILVVSLPKCPTIYASYTDKSQSYLQVTVKWN